jgi:hypothetical protein
MSEEFTSKQYQYYTQSAIKDYGFEKINRIASQLYLFNIQNLPAEDRLKFKNALEKFNLRYTPTPVSAGVDPKIYEIGDNNRKIAIQNYNNAITSAITQIQRIQDNETKHNDIFNVPAILDHVNKPINLNPDLRPPTMDNTSELDNEESTKGGKQRQRNSNQASNRAPKRSTSRSTSRKRGGKTRSKSKRSKSKRSRSKRSKSRSKK